MRVFGKGKCKLIANFSATMVTSLPSFSLCISLSLSLSHRMYLTHNIGSASALPIIRRVSLNISTARRSASCLVFARLVNCDERCASFATVYTDGVERRSGQQAGKQLLCKPLVVHFIGRRHCSLVNTAYFLGISLSSTDDAMPTAVPKIKLRSLEGEVFEVYRDSAKLSGLIAQKLENREAGDEKPVDLHVSTTLLRVMVEWCNRHMDDGPQSQETQKDEYGKFIIDPWDKEHLGDVDASRLRQIDGVARYLRIQGLVDVISRIVYNKRR